jgi:uracil-DNA glycosylase
LSVEIAAARPFLAEFITLLPHLKAIVLVGRKAQRIAPEILRWSNVRVFETHHPSQKVVNRWPERAQGKRLVNDLSDAYRTGNVGYVERSGVLLAR